MSFQTGRSGDEPVHARSALHLRLALAGFGLACGIGGVVLFAVLNIPALLGLFAALAVFAAVNCAVVLRHIRAGADYQPGPEVPPYRPSPARETTTRPSRPEVSPARRHMRFIVAAIGTMVLVINAWAWIWRFSVTASVVLTIVAGVLLLLGVIASNTGSPALRGNAVPDLDPRTGVPEADEEAAASERADREQHGAPQRDTADSKTEDHRGGTRRRKDR